jgi:alpha-ketoglutarate-dependent taurine dioxygenase
MRNETMKPTITPITETFAARVTDIDLRNMDEEAWRSVEEAFLKYGVLVFPGQNLTAEEQVAFAEHFGDIELLRPDPDQKAVAISNVKDDGSVLQPDERVFRTLRGNEGWHIDSTYMPLAAKGAVMTAQVVPEEDGETEWADMRAAYDALDEEKKKIVEDHSAYHSLD